MFFRTMGRKVFFRFSKISFFTFLGPFKKMFGVFCSFYVIMSLHAKKCVCRSNGLACGQYKDKEEKTPKKILKGPKNVKNEIFEKRKKTFFPIVLKNIFSKN